MLPNDDELTLIARPCAQ